MCPFDKHKNLYFDNEYDFHTNFKNYEESSNGLGLDLLTILCFIIYHLGKCNHLTPIHCGCFTNKHIQAACGVYGACSKAF